MTGLEIKVLKNSIVQNRWVLGLSHGIEIIATFAKNIIHQDQASG
jgi:hypothetical protein